MLDEKELKLVELLKRDYEKFMKPSFIKRSSDKIQSGISSVIPAPVKQFTLDKWNNITDTQFIVRAINIAGKGYGIFQTTAAKMTLNKEQVIKKLSKIDQNIEFNNISKLRSYQIEELLNKNKWKDEGIALIEGAGTGAAGFLGLPFNFALTTFLYFRAVQNVALMYGYDVKNDPRELEIASSVTMNCLYPNGSKDDDIMNVLGKMILFSELSSLNRSLVKNLTYKKMAERGGADLLFVQIRALAHKSAEKALQKAGKKGIENSILKKMLENLGEYLTKEVGKKGIPLVGAFVGGLSDLYMMNKLLKGANIIYHKRFLVEKPTRIAEANLNYSEILEYDDILKNLSKGVNDKK